ncbi:MAG TPA: hypothetical protein DCF93_10530 [Desulfuromonas sp.]|nr:hypothetical protein [Desulfuromonas sp.]
MKQILRAGAVLALATTLAATAGAETFSKNGYSIRLDARQRGDQVAISGRIDGGNPCHRLVLALTLRHAAGTKKTTELVVEDAGGIYSRLLAASLTVKTPVAPWSIGKVAVTCEEP